MGTQNTSGDGFLDRCEAALRTTEAVPRIEHDDSCARCGSRAGWRPASRRHRLVCVSCGMQSFDVASFNAELRGDRR